MKIIISPAKKMNTDTDTLAVEGLPAYLHRTKQILSYFAGTFPAAGKRAVEMQ